IIAAALLLAGDAPFATSLAIPAAALLVVSGWVLFRSDSTPQRQAWRDSGDFKVWPFLRVEDFDAARTAICVLTSGEVTTVRIVGHTKGGSFTYHFPHVM